MWINRSIKRRLSCWLLGGIAVIMLTAGIILDLLAVYQLRRAYDQALLAKARAIVTLTEQSRDGVELEFADEFMPEFEAEKQPSYFQLWLADGSTLERSRSLGGADLKRLPALADTPRFVDGALPDGRAGRSVQIDFIVQVDEADRSSQLPRQAAILVVAEERVQAAFTRKQRFAADAAHELRTPLA